MFWLSYKTYYKKHSVTKPQWRGKDVAAEQAAAFDAFGREKRQIKARLSVSSRGNLWVVLPAKTPFVHLLHLSVKRGVKNKTKKKKRERRNGAYVKSTRQSVRSEIIVHVRKK